LLSEEPQTMSLTATEIALLIRKAIPDATIALAGVTPDGNTVRAFVSSKAFAGLSMDQRHELVYSALKTRMGNRPSYTLRLATSVLP